MNDEKEASSKKHIQFKTRVQKQLPYILYIVLTSSILVDQEPPAYFENSHDYVDKHDYSIICYPVISADYTVRSAHA